MITLGGFRPDPKPEPREKKKKKPLSKKSKKQDIADKAYTKRGKVWLEEKTCECCNEDPATQVHHKKGRKGFADQWALLRGIKLIHDERFWLATCSNCHIEVETNPEWAMQEGYSETRTDILVK